MIYTQNMVFDGTVPPFLAPEFPIDNKTHEQQPCVDKFPAKLMRFPHVFLYVYPVQPSKHGNYDGYM